MFPQVGGTELNQVPQYSIFLIPHFLFCENLAAFKFLSDGPENPGGASFVFQDTQPLACSPGTFAMLYRFVPQIFSQPIVFSPFLQKLVLPRALEDSELCKNDPFGSGHDRLYVPKGKYGIRDRPCGFFPRNLGFRVSELILVGASI